MKRDKKVSGRIWLSRLYLLAAIVVLFQTCRICLPEESRQVTQTVRQAFSVMTDALHNGESAVQAFSRSYRVLNGEQD